MCGASGFVSLLVRPRTSRSFPSLRSGQALRFTQDGPFASLRTGPSLHSGQALRFAEDRPFALLRTGPSLRSGLARDCNGVGIASFGRSFVGPAAPGLLRMTTREALIRMDNDNAFQDESGAGPPQDDSLTVILSEPSDRGRGCHPEGAAKRRPKDRVFSQGHLHSLRTTNGLPAAVCEDVTSGMRSFVGPAGLLRMTR